MQRQGAGGVGPSQTQVEQTHVVPARDGGLPAREGRPVLTVVVDLIAPIALYYGSRSAGAGIFLALIIGALPPGLSAAAKIVKYRRVDRLAVLVLTMLLLSTGVSLISGSPRFLLAKDGWLTGAWALVFFASLLGRRPGTFVFSRPLLEGRRVWDRTARKWRAPAGESWDDLWERVPRFRRVWQVSTAFWGGGILVDAVIRVIMAYALPLDVVPGLGGALWPATFIVLQVITNIYFTRSGLWLILLGELDPPPPQADELHPVAVAEP